MTTATDNAFVKSVTKKKTKIRRGDTLYDKVIDFVTMRRAKGTTGYIYKALKKEWNTIPRNKRSLKAIPIMGL